MHNGTYVSNYAAWTDMEIAALKGAIDSGATDPNEILGRVNDVSVKERSVTGIRDKLRQLAADREIDVPAKTLTNLSRAAAERTKERAKKSTAIMKIETIDLSKIEHVWVNVKDMIRICHRSSTWAKNLAHAHKAKRRTGSDGLYEYRLPDLIAALSSAEQHAALDRYNTKSYKRARKPTTKKRAQAHQQPSRQTQNEKEVATHAVKSIELRSKIEWIIQGCLTMGEFGAEEALERIQAVLAA